MLPHAMRTAQYWPLVLASVVILLGPSAPAQDQRPAADPLAPWRQDVRVSPVSSQNGVHTIHAYFNVSPESPDGRWVVFYASTTLNGHDGEVRVLERASGKEVVLARDVSIEDAHRAACQQWASGGRSVLFHNVQGKTWSVIAVDLETRTPRVLAQDRQLGWGQATGDFVPLYGCHWNPGEHRDLELVDLKTGQIKTAVRADDVVKTYQGWITRQFGDKKVSIFFPILSPDQKRIFFKMATPAGGDFRSSKASMREGLVCYDLEHARFLFLRERWGHPAWHPDSRTIIEPGGVLLDAETGAMRRIAGLPPFSGSHPTISPDGQLFVTDTTLQAFGGTKKDWGIVVGSMQGKDYLILHRFDNSQGARSWRKSHPHPAFSPDGKRIYFNVNATAWTQLHVAEAKP